MRGNFENCLKVTLPFEGGYVNHPRDPGGPTNKGITQRTLSAYLGRPATVEDVKKISDTTVHAIYKKQYWDRVWGDMIPKGVDLIVFDYAVNSGPARAVKQMQRLVGAVSDGIMGMQTLSKIKEYCAEKGTTTLITNYSEGRMAFLRQLSHWGTFGTGWTRRVKGVAEYALKMVDDDTDYKVPDVAQNPSKANQGDISIPNVVASPKEGLGPTLTVGGTLGEIINSISATIMPYTELSVVIKILCVALIVTGVSITSWQVYKKYKKGELNI